MGIYVDNSATTAIDTRVRDAMLPYLSDLWGNASSLHELGHVAHDALNTAREELAGLLNCQSEEVYFTTGGTLSNNIALLGRARFAEANDLGKHLITSAIEHSAILGPAKFLESSGWKVTYLSVDQEGLININDLQNAINKNTSIISIAWANNEIGTIQPIKELSNIAKQANVFFHTDAIQVPGKLEIDLNEMPISALSLSGHKFNAPKGIGVLFIRKGCNVMPITFGGGQEQGLFPGTENVANIVGMGKAALLAKQELTQTRDKLLKMQKQIVERLSSLTNIQFTGPTDLNKRLPGHISLIVSAVSGETLVLRCDLHGIYLSSGSACNNKIIQPSHVLKSLGLTDQEALGAIRISLGKFNTEAECEELVSSLENIFRLEEPAFKTLLSSNQSNNL